MAARAAHQPPPVAAAPSTVKRVPSSADVRNNFNNTLNSTITTAIDSFREVVQSCEIGDRVATARADFQAQVQTANLMHSLESMLRLVSDLKVATIVQEVSESKQESNELRAIYDGESKVTRNAIGALREQLATTLAALETHYYRSCTTWGFSDATGKHHDKDQPNLPEPDVDMKDDTT